MQQNINTTDHKQWWIAHGPEVVIFGEAEIGVRTCTGQPNLEIFNDEEPWADRVRELGHEPYQPEDELLLDEPEDEILLDDSSV